MNNNTSKIVTLIPSATEIVAFLGLKNSIIGRSHECDYPHDLNHITKLTSPKINVDGTSGEIDKQINVILENSLSVYKVDVEQLKKLKPDMVITQAHCDVCAVSLSDVEKIIGLETGADDYLLKPILPRELVARIKAVMRRYQPAVIPPTSSNDHAEAGGNCKTQPRKFSMTFFMNLFVKTSHIAKGVGVFRRIFLFTGFTTNIGDKRHDNIARHTRS